MLGGAASSNGWAYEVVLPFEGPLAEHLRSINIPVHILAMGVLRSRRELRSLKLIARLGEVPMAVVRLLKIIRSDEIDIVHSNTSVVIAGAIAAKLAGKPHVWHVREILSGPLWQGLKWLILRLSVRVVCISAAVRDNFIPTPSRLRNKIKIIPNGLNMDDFDGVSGPGDPSRRSVAMIARINPWKGHAVFLEAAALVNRQLEGVNFYLIGGCSPQYQDLRAKLLYRRDVLGLSESAHFIDHLSKNELKTLMALTQVVVLPSTKPEPFGLVIIEAMALRLPVIASAQGGPLEIIDDGKNGLLVAPNSPAPMAAAIIRLLSDDSLRSRLGRNGAEKVRRCYSLAMFNREIGALYGSI